MQYYENAVRLDPSNAAYTFELAKIYHYYGKSTRDGEVRARWLEKARKEGEISVNGNKCYPAYMKTLVGYILIPVCRSKPWRWPGICCFTRGTMLKCMSFCQKLY